MELPSAPPPTVILVGFMGAGKSTVGRVLARRLGLCFVETDDMITAGEGKSIPEIFAERGEAHFRTLEAAVLEALADKRGHVIATGGGFPCRPGVMERLRALGTVVWLAADFDTLYTRASRLGARPMLATRSRDEAAALYEARKPHYARAHLAVEVGHLGVDGAVSGILRHLRERARAGRPRGATARRTP
ncbi:MAG TPA: shikimate kinase [Methylomirabilota bacterium]|jgi:shikimate kinase|nr:shikimate kinase [Methylomirabilota bacterium]